MQSNFFADQRTRWVALAALALVALITVLYLPPVFDAVGAEVVYPIYDVSIIVVALAAAVMAIMVARSLEPGEVLRTMWQALGVGLLLWGSGEAIWAGYDLFSEEIPFPSAADVLWLVGYIPFFVALFLRYRTLRATPEPARVLTIVVLSAILIGVAGYYVIWPIIQDTETELLPKIIYVLYPLGDVIVAIVALLVVLTLSGGELSRPWAMLAAGFIIVSVADLLFNYADWQEIYRAGESMDLLTALVDIPYYASYLFMLVGLYMQGRLQKVF
jgi:hypothetical protein